ncbi:DUF2188 domain-containing protein [Stratiformator vulcanicus]|uniref:DUF2188 domain-containing protein n=1 Tax=Stratiformator vulcanicus TaxID=2527980 RepID=A0A517R6N1_9PLAN|nr:DUF2188 domain-containing protein [Stratiformator vulcanicus]QDT39538.1 hypothetical protein Pan189_39460 [Stratiformator vulcanicus]
MATDTFHVVTHDDGWAVKRQGESDPTSTHSTQKEAVEAAVGAEDDVHQVVIHKRDGQIRDVRTVDGNGETASNEQSNGRTSTETRRTMAETVVSTGIRIRWGAVIAGFFMALAASTTLSVLGMCLALCLSYVMSADALQVFVGTWVALAMLGSLFFGGMIISRLTVGEEGPLEPTVYGAILWSLFIFAVPAISALGMNMGYGALSGGSDGGVAISTEQLEEAGLEEEQISAVQGMMSTEQSVIPAFEGNATEVAWLTFAAILLSLGAAIAGSFFGAGLREPTTA